MKKWLLIDCNNLCHRAFHAMGDLSHNDIPTGVLFGFFKDLQRLQKQFDTSNVVFCFDFGKGKRYKLLQGYKGTRRKNETFDDRQRRKVLHDQMTKLRKDYLPKLGYSNVFYAKGYEADDIIASLVMSSIPKEDEAVIVSSDSDLWQLIRGNVSVHSLHKGKPITLQSFFKEWKLTPIEWWRVKAMAGCSSDDIPGIQGVGEKTAAKYMRGELKPDYEVFRKIESREGHAIVKRNRKLVKLPLSGTPRYELQNDSLNEEAWKEIVKELGFDSMDVDNVSPIQKRRRNRKIIWNG